MNINIIFYLENKYLYVSKKNKKNNLINIHHFSIYIIFFQLLIFRNCFLLPKSKKPIQIDNILFRNTLTL